MPRSGAGDLPVMEVVVPGVDDVPKRGVFAGSDVASAGDVPRENGCIFDRSGFFFDPVVFH